ncbi:MAG: hypothetical protein M1826_006430 [Phylliscum demangeonii]|nr:MAG: hypothetical protein M1826_006430 [Phylliscum demangeonii]
MLPATAKTSFLSLLVLVLGLSITLTVASPARHGRDVGRNRRVLRGNGPSEGFAHGPPPGFRPGRGPASYPSPSPAAPDASSDPASSSTTPDPTTAAPSPTAPDPAQDSSTASAGASPASSSDPLSTATLPLNGNGLPSPLAGLSVKIVAVGRGTQNYTCATSDSSTTPVAIGAVADLFDGRALVSANANANDNNYDALTTATNTALNDPAAGGLPAIGQHFFAGPTPVFAVPDTGTFFGSKLAAVPAPGGANAGTRAEGAVDWLDLADKGGSSGIAQVYRLETAGGKPPADCSGQQPTLEVPYAAQYWMLA